MTAEEFLIKNDIFNSEVGRLNGVVAIKKRISDIMEEYAQSKCYHPQWDNVSDSIFKRRQCSGCGKIQVYQDYQGWIDTYKF